jgi:hypothetical protein
MAADGAALDGRMRWTILSTLTANEILAWIDVYGDTFSAQQAEEVRLRLAPAPPVADPAPDDDEASPNAARKQFISETLRTVFTIYPTLRLPVIDATDQVTTLEWTDPDCRVEVHESRRVVVNKREFEDWSAKGAREAIASAIMGALGPGS